MISKRIKLIASLIDKNESVIDVGCDHAYLALNLRDNNHKAKILCIDNKQGPLNAAINTINQYKLKDCETLLSNGLENVSVKYDVVVMAGIGFHTVIDIILKKYDLVDKAIIQVNNDVDKMRKWLVENGFEIIDERVIFDYKYYEVLVVRKGKQELNEEEIQLGKFNIQTRDPAFVDYVHFRINKIENILKNASNKELEKLLVILKKHS